METHKTREAYISHCQKAFIEKEDDAKEWKQDPETCESNPNLCTTSHVKYVSDSIFPSDKPDNRTIFFTLQNPLCASTTADLIASASSIEFTDLGIVSDPYQSLYNHTDISCITSNIFISPRHDGCQIT